METITPDALRKERALTWRLLRRLSSRADLQRRARSISGGIESAKTEPQSLSDSFGPTHGKGSPGSVTGATLWRHRDPAMPKIATAGSGWYRGRGRP